MRQQMSTGSNEGRQKQMNELTGKQMNERANHLQIEPIGNVYIYIPIIYTCLKQKLREHERRRSRREQEKQRGKQKEQPISARRQTTGETRATTSTPRASALLINAYKTRLPLAQTKNGPLHQTSWHRALSAPDPGKAHDTGGKGMGEWNAAKGYLCKNQSAQKSNLQAMSWMPSE